MRLPRVYPILDTESLDRRAIALETAAAALLDGGAGILQIRHKGHWSRGFFDSARAVARLCREAGAVLVVNDRADFAMLLEAGLHVGQDDLPPRDARRLMGPDASIGFSSHNVNQLCAAGGEPVDYVAFGPVFATASKLNPDPVTGVEEIRRCRSLIEKPLVAIGGITQENAVEVLRAGADSVAVIAGLLPDHATAHSLRERMEEWQQLVKNGLIAGENSLIKGLGLVDSTTLVMGSMIGSGVFIVAADISRQVQSPGLMMMTWVVTALLTLIAALSYGELAAAMPHAGGQYVYLREAFGPLAGFLFGWTMFAVIQTGTIAAVAVAFAKYTGIFFPSISDQNYLVGSGGIGVTTQQLLAIAVIVFLTWSNTYGIRTGAVVQNVFTFAKIGALLGLVGAGFLVGRNPAAIASNFTDFWRNAGWNFESVRLVGVAMVGSLFSSDAWNNVTFTAGEVRNPKRNLPLSLALGVAIVSALYIACNMVYLNVLTFDAIQHADKDRVAAAAASSMFGPVAVQIMAAAIMISTFGCINGLTLSGARVYYAMAKDKLFFRQAGTLNPKTHAPVFSLTVQCIWACLLTLSGRYNDLLDYVIFAVLLFYILTIAGLFVLRRTRPEMERPYKAFGYPVLPAIYMFAAGLIEILLLMYKPNYTWPGLIIVLLGLPVYFIWRKKATI